MTRQTVDGQRRANFYHILCKPDERCVQASLFIYGSDNKLYKPQRPRQERAKENYLLILS